MEFTYRPRGVCSQLMEIEVEGDRIKHVKVTGGCSGNLQGISRLVEGMEIKEAAALAADFVLAAMEATTGDEKHWYGVHFEQALPLLMERLVIE